MSRRGRSSRGLQVFAVLLLLVMAIGLSYLALTRDVSGDATAVDPESSITSSAPGDPSQSPSVEDLDVPKVPDQRRADFTAGDDLPDGTRMVDSGENITDLEVTAEGLTHGPVKGEGAGSGFAEVKLKSDVESLGFRVRFVGESSGAAVLAAWSDSYAASAEALETQPTAGMYFTAAPGEWTLSVMDKETTEVAGGTYPVANGPVEFELIRDGDTVYVLDPSGKITTATRPGFEALAGPWASWGLREGSSAEVPAVIEAVWAG